MSDRSRARGGSSMHRMSRPAGGVRDRLLGPLRGDPPPILLPSAASRQGRARPPPRGSAAPRPRGPGGGGRWPGNRSSCPGRYTDCSRVPGPGPAPGGGTESGGTEGGGAMVGDAGAGAWCPRLAADELPVAVPGQRMLVHTATVAVWLSEVHVYTGGVQFALEARCRERGAVCDPVADPGGVLLGMVDADGTVASTLPGRSGLRCLGGVRARPVGWGGICCSRCRRPGRWRCIWPGRDWRCRRPGSSSRRPPWSRPRPGAAAVAARAGPGPDPRRARAGPAPGGVVGAVRGMVRHRGRPAPALALVVSAARPRPATPRGPAGRVGRGTVVRTTFPRYVVGVVVLRHPLHGNADRFPTPARRGWVRSRRHTPASAGSSLFAVPPRTAGRARGGRASVNYRLSIAARRGSRCPWGRRRGRRTRARPAPATRTPGAGTSRPRGRLVPAGA